jgi:hypothetical protein
MSEMTPEDRADVLFRSVVRDVFDTEKDLTVREMRAAFKILMAAAISEAVEAEREACAMVADETESEADDYFFGNFRAGASRAAKEIKEKIRSRSVAADTTKADPESQSRRRFRVQRGHAR